MKKKKRLKLYLVKREVIATSVREALKKSGSVYEIAVTKEEEWPQEKTPLNGFAEKLRKRLI